MKLPWFVLLATCGCSLAADLWVAPTGRDSHPGTREEPLATIARGVQLLQPGMTLNVLPGPKPWPANIRITVSGTKDAPIIVDGHGSVVSGRGKLPAAAWTDEGNHIFSRRLPNNAWGMERHWEGGFPLVWFSGRPGVNVGSCTELTAGSYFLHKNRKEQRTDPLHNTLYVRLAPGEKIEDVESIIGEGGIFVGGSHVIVRNFITEYGGRDGFATSRNQGVVFENIEARYFMDQGTSQHGSEVTVRRAHFHHNAGAGIVDVYPECRTRYENCLIEADTWRGGVEFHKGEFEMVNCLIRANAKKALTVTKGARVTLRNCVLLGDAAGESLGITVGDRSRLIMQNCTVIGFRTGLSSVLEGHTRIRLEDCRFQQCGQAFRINLRHDLGGTAPNLSEQFIVKDVSIDRSEIEINTKTQKSDRKWQVKTTRFPATEKATLRRHFGNGLRFTAGPTDFTARYPREWPFDQVKAK